MWNKEKQSLLVARTHSLEKAEERVEELATLKNYYKDITKEQQTTIDNQDKTLDKQNDLIKRITALAESNTCNNEKAILDKIKELVSDYQSLN